MFIFQLLITVVGVAVVPIGMTRMRWFSPEHKTSHGSFQREFKWKWFDNIFGNHEDGLADIYYMQKYPKPYKATWWRTYNWYAIRNPVHNLALWMGVNEVITDYVWKGNRYTADTIGREGFVYSVATGASGKKYPMYRWCKLFYKDYGIEMNLGYKNFNIRELGKHYKYSFTVSINPIKKFEPAR